YEIYGNVLYASDDAASMRSVTVAGAHDNLIAGNTAGDSANPYVQASNQGTGSMQWTIAAVSAAAITPTVTLTASPASIAAGGTSLLSWTSTASVACGASGGWTGTKATSGSETVG